MMSLDGCVGSGRFSSRPVQPCVAHPEKARKKNDIFCTRRTEHTGQARAVPACRHLPPPMPAPKHVFVH